MIFPVALTVPTVKLVPPIIAPPIEAVPVVKKFPEKEPVPAVKVVAPIIAPENDAVVAVIVTLPIIAPVALTVPTVNVLAIQALAQRIDDDPRSDTVSPPQVNEVSFIIHILAIMVMNKN